MNVTTEIFYRKLWKTQYAGKTLKPDERVRLKAILKNIRRYIGSNRDFKICEVGSGRGIIAASLYGKGYKNIVAVEPVKAAIEISQQLFPYLNVFHGDSHDAALQYGGCAFRCIISTEVIEHVPYAAQMDYLRDIHSLLESGGILLLTTPKQELRCEWEKFNYEVQPVEDWVTEPQLRELMVGAGFKLLVHSRLYLPFLKLDWIDKLLSCRFIRSLPDFPLLSDLREKYGFIQYCVAQKQALPKI